jgi:tetratricopeptide (TPR) repeat protein
MTANNAVDCWEKCSGKGGLVLMPQVFSSGWLYLFIIVMVISIVRIWFKLRTIQKEAPMDRPVIKVPPVFKQEQENGDVPEADSFLAGPDELIRQGDYETALGLLNGLLEDLSPTEEREQRGKVLFRIGACHSRLTDGEEKLQHMLRAGESLREAVRLFSPARFRNHYLRALGELAALYEDIAREKNPVEYLTQSARTCETAADSARQGGMTEPEAIFLMRAGNAYRQLASHNEAQVNLRRAADAYEKAAAALGTVQDEGVDSEKIKISKLLGDTLMDLSAYFQKGESLARAVNAYETALEKWMKRCTSGSVLWSRWTRAKPSWNFTILKEARLTSVRPCVTLVMP